MSEYYVSAIDLGSYYVIGAVAKKSENGIEIIDVEKEKTEPGCIEKGELLSVDKAAMHISRLIQKLKNGALIQEINYVYVTWHGMKQNDEKCGKLMKKLWKKTFIQYPDKSSDALITAFFTTENERNRGVLTIDFGDTFTTYTYLNDNEVGFEGSLPGGSRIITTDLQAIFNFPYELAEKLKIMFGKALPTEGSDQLISIDKENKKTIRVSELTNEIMLRIEDIFKRILYNMVSRQWNSNKERIILLAGGGAKLPYLDKLLNRQTGLEVKLAKCKDGMLTGDKALKMLTPEYALILSLINYADKPCDAKRPKKSMLSKVFGLFNTDADTDAETQITLKLFSPSEENEKM